MNNLLLSVLIVAPFAVVLLVWLADELKLACHILGCKFTDVPPCWCIRCDRPYKEGLKGLR